MQKKVLFTGGSHAEMPMIEAAKAQGLYVITTGANEDGLGHKIADKYVKGDFSDKEFIVNLAQSEGVDYIVSGCNDFAYLSTAYACEKLGIPGHDSYATAKLIHTKSSFREMTAKIGIKTPKVFRCCCLDECRKAMDEIGMPFIMKPVDLTGGKGVKLCRKAEELESAFEEAMSVTRKNYVIIEQYIQGTNHGITALIKNHKVVFYIVDNEQYGENKYLVLGACSPSAVPQFAIFRLICDIQKVAEHCDLVDGLFHTQFILTEKQEPVIIDPCRRAPGDLYVLLAKYATEVDYPAEIVKAECGEKLQDAYHMNCHFIARECIMSKYAGELKSVEISDEVKCRLIDQCLWYKKGELIDNPLKYKAGILITKHESYEDMMYYLKHYEELVHIVVG